MKQAYLFGQILGTHSFYLKDGFPIPDEYSEIHKKFFLPGGETGSAATVMASLGIVISVLGFDGAGTAMVLAIFALQDSFGTACNVTGDGALTLILTGYAKKHNIEENSQKAVEL